jgi:hypothetical protein
VAGEGKGHPLPGSGEARHNEIPEGLEHEKGLGQDPAEVTSPHPGSVNPDGEPYRYDVARESRAPHGSALSGGQGDPSNGRGPPTDKGVDERPAVERGEPEPGP